MVEISVFWDAAREKFGSYLTENILRLCCEDYVLVLHREIIAVCSQIYTKHTNTLYGQNVELLNVKLAVHIVTIGLRRFNIHYT
jgi:hypothetical protein